MTTTRGNTCLKEPIHPIKKEPPKLRLVLNECHEEVIWDGTRFKVINAGRGWGKTQSILAIIADHVQTPFTDQHGHRLKHNVWYIAPTLKQGREIFWERLKEFFYPLIKKTGKKLHINESRMTIRLKNGALIGIKGSNKSDNLRGPYLTLAIFDEFAFHKPNYWQKIIRPMLGRVKPFGKAVFLSTPDGHNEFYQLAQMGMDNEKKNWSYHHYQSVDGGFIPMEEIEDAKADMSYEEWRQEYFGEFMATAGRAYYGFNRTDNCKNVQHIPGQDIHWFWDFNEVPHCHSGLAHVYKGRVYVFDEIATGNTPHCVEDFVLKYPIDKICDPETGRQPKIYIYGDASGNHSTSGLSDYMAVQQYLEAHGYDPPEIQVTSMNPLVKNRVLSVNTMMCNAHKERRIFVNRDNCPFLLRDLEQVKWKEMKSSQGKPELDKTTDARLTHASDGLGYMIWAKFPITPPEERSTKRHNKVKTLYGYPIAS